MRHDLTYLKGSCTSYASFFSCTAFAASLIVIVKLLSPRVVPAVCVSVFK